MALAEELTKWSSVFEDLAQKKARRPYIGELADLGMDFERARAEEQKARAGMAGLQLQFEPQRQQQLTEQGRLANLINQMKIKQMQAAMEAPQGPSWVTDFGRMLGEQKAVEEYFGPESPQAAMYRQSLEQKLAEKEPAYATEFGKILGEQQRIAEQFGPESPQAQQYQQFLESKLPGAAGAVAAPMLTPFEGPSGVPLEIVPTGQKDKILRKDPITNDYYQPISEARLNANLGKINTIESVVDDLQKLEIIAPIFASGFVGNLRDTQKLISDFTGVQFEGANKKAAGDAILATIKDKIMKLEGFPSLQSAYSDAEKIVKIGKGESTEAYGQRIDRLREKFKEQLQNLDEEVLYGTKITGKTREKLKKEEEKERKEKESTRDWTTDRKSLKWATDPITGKFIIK
jgi:septum formation inhibitor MinC